MKNGSTIAGLVAGGGSALILFGIVYGTTSALMVRPVAVRKCFPNCAGSGLDLTLNARQSAKQRLQAVELDASQVYRKL